MEDDAANLWLGGLRGIHRVPRAALVFPGTEPGEVLRLRPHRARVLRVV